MTVALLATAFGLGLRHGVDWDHIAAIGDLSGSTHDRRRGLFLSFLYAVGHAAVVFALGAAAVIAGAAIPDSLDRVMGYLVGASLVALAVWVIVSLVRDGREFRLRSRWMLMLGGTFAGLRRVRNRSGYREISVEHDHDHDHDRPADDVGAHLERAAHDHAHVEAAADASVGVPDPVGSAPAGRSRWFERGHHHSHAHRHDLALPDSAAAGYGPGSATGVGMLHGVGIESPTQIGVFVASTSVAGTVAGLTLLAAWVVGLVVANSVLALAMSAGLLGIDRNFRVYAAVAVAVAAMSLFVGLGYLGLLPGLPAIEL